MGGLGERTTARRCEPGQPSGGGLGLVRRRHCAGHVRNELMFRAPTDRLWASPIVAADARGVRARRHHQHCHQLCRSRIRPTPTGRHHGFTAKLVNWKTLIREANVANPSAKPTPLLASLRRARACQVPEGRPQATLPLLPMPRGAFTAVIVGRSLTMVQRYAGAHSRARLCASASWSGVRSSPTRSRLVMASLRRGSDAAKRAAARLNHIYALTKSGCLPSCPL
jgi:hypothetical protein